MRMNINEFVYVRLSKFGLCKVQELGLEGCIPDPDAYGWTKMQMWELMRYFGPFMHLGGDMPFQNNEIRIGDA